MTDWKGFMKDVADGSRPKYKPCSVGTLLARTDVDTRQVRDALANDAYTSSAIALELRRRLGADAPTEYSIRYHRRGKCQCGRQS